MRSRRLPPTYVSFSDATEDSSDSHVQFATVREGRQRATIIFEDAISRGTILESPLASAGGKSGKLRAVACRSAWQTFRALRNVEPIRRSEKSGVINYNRKQSKDIVIFRSLFLSFLVLFFFFFLKTCCTCVYVCVDEAL